MHLHLVVDLSAPGSGLMVVVLECKDSVITVADLADLVVWIGGAVVCGSLLYFDNVCASLRFSSLIASLSSISSVNERISGRCSFTRRLR